MSSGCQKKRDCKGLITHLGILIAIPTVISTVIPAAIVTLVLIARPIPTSVPIP